MYKDVFLHSDTHERGTKRYRLFLRGITCEAVIKKKDLRAFRYLRFTSKDIMNATGSLCSLNVLGPMGSLGLRINNEVIYKIDKPIFDFMFGLRTFNGYDIFDKMESVINEIWSRFRAPTEDGKTWLYFVFGNKEADQLIINAHDLRNKITNGGSYGLELILKIRVIVTVTNGGSYGLELILKIRVIVTVVLMFIQEFLDFSDSIGQINVS